MHDLKKDVLFFWFVLRERKYVRLNKCIECDEQQSVEASVRAGLRYKHLDSCATPLLIAVEMSYLRDVLIDLRAMGVDPQKDLPLVSAELARRLAVQ